uniref:Chromosome 1 open reading frame 174 n=1 Tax=Pelusios castaneus TaxID=367368 RepID=A0A8C8SKN9_9SAUR
MRTRKLADGGPSSTARQKGGNNAANQSSSQEVDFCKSSKTVHLASSHKATDRRPSKRLKCDKTSLVKRELQELVTGNGSVPLLKEPTETCDEEQHLRDSVDPHVKSLQSKSIPKTNNEIQGNENNVSIKPSALNGNSCPPKKEEGETFLQNRIQNAEEESSCETAYSDESGLETRDLQKKPIQLDDSAFLDEDSNQPMPVDRFFGNIELMQDLPAAALTCATMSRRELRKLHFIAKEDDDDDAL